MVLDPRRCINHENVIVVNLPNFPGSVERCLIVLDMWHMVRPPRPPLGQRSLPVEVDDGDAIAHVRRDDRDVLGETRLSRAALRRSGQKNLFKRDGWLFLRWCYGFSNRIAFAAC